MFRPLSIVALALVPASIMLPTSKAAAQEFSAVQTFVRVCYSQVPRLQGIRNMATQLGWVPLAGVALAPFAEGTDADIIEGWDVELDEQSYKLSLIQGPLTKSQKDEFPDLTDARVTTCTLTLLHVEDGKAIADEMQELAGKPPETKDVEEGAHKVTTWAGGNDAVKVFLKNKALKAEEGGALSVTLIANP